MNWEHRVGCPALRNATETCVCPKFKKLEYDPHLVIATDEQLDAALKAAGMVKGDFLKKQKKLSEKDKD